jgi:hypothetical protein
LKTPEGSRALYVDRAAARGLSRSGATRRLNDGPCLLAQISLGTLTGREHRTADRTAYAERGGDLGLPLEAGRSRAWTSTHDAVHPFDCENERDGLEHIGLVPLPEQLKLGPPNSVDEDPQNALAKCDGAERSIAYSEPHLIPSAVCGGPEPVIPCPRQAVA